MRKQTLSKIIIGIIVVGLPIAAGLLFVKLQSYLSNEPIPGIELMNEAFWLSPGHQPDYQTAVTTPEWQDMDNYPSAYTKDPTDNWIRFTLKNTNDTIQGVSIVPSSMYIDVFQLYIPVGSGEYQVLKTGENIVAKNRSNYAITPAVTVHLPPHSEQTYYAWIQDSLFSDAWIDIRPEAKQIRAEKLELVQFGIYFALLGGLFLIYFLFYLVLREEKILHYLIYLGSFAFLILVASNASGIFFGWSSDLIRYKMLLVGLSLTSMALLNFARHFLELPQWGKQFNRMTQMLISVGFVISLISITDVGARTLMTSYDWMYFGYSVLCLIMALTLGAIACFQKVSGSVIFLAAFVPMALGFLYNILAQFYIVPYDLTNGFPMLAGSGLEMMFLGMALAYQYRSILHKHDQLQQNYLDELKNAVENRTAELQNTTRDLKAALGQRDRILRIIGHDLRNLISPTYSIGSIFQSQKSSLSQEKVQEYGNDLIFSANSQFELLENLIAWGNSTTHRKTEDALETVDIRSAVLKATSYLEPIAANKQVALKVDEFFPETTIPLHEKGFITILRNLISNAIKYSKPHHDVIIDCHEETQFVHVQVRDQGIGMDQSSLNSLNEGGGNSRAGTLGEPGSGLGIPLCHELAATMNAEIEFSSEPDKGTTAVLRISKNA